MLPHREVVPAGSLWHDDGDGGQAGGLSCLDVGGTVVPGPTAAVGRGVAEAHPAAESGEQIGHVGKKFRGAHQTSPMARATRAR